jgi:gamma-glutamyltranspeptidase/glutathione hydrolase
MLAALKKGNAADAITCGLFAAAALDPSVLLGPAQILFGGTGAGMRAIDGRCRQPGAGTKRPRGYREGDRIPDAARVAVPGLPSAAMLLHATLGHAPISTLGSIIKPLARTASPVRFRVIERVLGAGAAALAKLPEFVAWARASEGCLLTAADLESVRPRDERCAIEQSAVVIGRAPWEHAIDRPVELLAASDARGLVAVACYEAPERGLHIEALDLVAPLVAEPVRRGIPRVRPGEPLEAPCPLALLAPVAENKGKIGSAQQAIAARTERSLRACLDEIAQGGLSARDVLFVSAG